MEVTSTELVICDDTGAEDVVASPDRMSVGGRTGVRPPVGCLPHRR